ncbi:MAG TPA: DUF262 domain-containing protein [Gammaproteobacteria bacterium]|nr:DUF262 domain-containing protein [Gammaproteobacteria bacterium]
MRKPRRAEYTPLDFAQWKAGNSLSLSPKFQRRSVWKPAARSFFIDSLLRRMPVPPVYLRETQSPERDRVIREVIDGQQRISAVMDFMEGKYRLAKTLKESWAGKTFDDLTREKQDHISTYAFSVEVFHGISDLEVLEIFSRLNTYSVSLNKQELRNGRFFGLFKQAVYSTAYEHLEFWRRHRIFTEQNIARMLEVEFVSEVFIAFLEGMQDKKKSIDSFYEKYDEEFREQARVEKRFRSIIDDTSEIVGDVLADTVFRRPPILYSLLCVLYHRRYGLPATSISSPKKILSSADRLSLREAVESLSARVESARSGEDVTGRYAPFVKACLQQTDNIRPRETRFRTLYTVAFR